MDWGATIAIALIVLIVGGAIAYIIHAKKSGKKCIGCPDSANCGGKCSSCHFCVKDNQDDVQKENNDD